MLFVIEEDEVLSRKEGPLLESDTAIEVSVGELVGTGDGRYAVTYTTNDRSLPVGTVITCSVKYWRGMGGLEKGQVISVKGVVKYVKGWRAFEAHPITPETSNEREERG